MSKIDRLHLGQALGAALLALAAGGCAGGGARVENRPLPDWFVAKQKDLRNADYPELAAVPEPPKDGQRADSAWAAIEAELEREGQAVLNDPRNAPADLRDLGVFEEEAREEVNRARTAPQ